MKASTLSFVIILLMLLNMLLNMEPMRQTNSTIEDLEQELAYLRAINDKKEEERYAKFKEEVDEFNKKIQEVIENWKSHSNYNILLKRYGDENNNFAQAQKKLESVLRKEKMILSNINFRALSKMTEEDVDNLCKTIKKVAQKEKKLALEVENAKTQIYNVYNYAELKFDLEEEIPKDLTLANFTLANVVFCPRNHIKCWFDFVLKFNSKLKNAKSMLDKKGSESIFDVPRKCPHCSKMVIDKAVLVQEDLKFVPQRKSRHEKQDDYTGSYSVYSCMDMYGKHF